MKTGIAHLPLHHGRAPAWLFSRMKRLAAEISSIIVWEHGTDDFLSRLSDPFWFQAFGCVLGFDWHSSGLTTTVCGALKEGLRQRSRELGLFICGGKGAASRKTPREIMEIGDARLVSADPARLVYSSRMSAKVDSTALQDGYQLYHHCFVFDREGRWAVIQQGMNIDTRWARRYHWLGSAVKDFVCEPHSAICCEHRSEVLNMVARESEGCRKVSAALVGEEPGKVVADFEKARQLKMPLRHSVSLQDIQSKNLRKIMEKTYEQMPPNFEALIGIEGVGPKTVRALSLISELLYGAPASIRDPARFSFAHGGKDGHPYPVNRQEYDKSIQILADAINRAKIERTEKLEAMRRLKEI